MRFPFITRAQHEAELRIVNAELRVTDREREEARIERDLERERATQLAAIAEAREARINLQRELADVMEQRTALAIATRDDTHYDLAKERSRFDAERKRFAESQRALHLCESELAAQRAIAESARADLAMWRDSVREMQRNLATAYESIAELQRRYAPPAPIEGDVEQPLSVLDADAKVVERMRNPAPEEQPA